MSPAGAIGGSPNLREPATFSPGSSCSFAAFATPTPVRTRPRATIPAEEPATSPLASPVKERLELSMLGGAPLDDEEDGLSTITPLEL